MPDAKTLQILIEIQKRKIEKLDEQIGRLMSKRASAEERLGTFHEQLHVQYNLGLKN